MKTLVVTEDVARVSKNNGDGYLLYRDMENGGGTGALVTGSRDDG